MDFHRVVKGNTPGLSVQCSGCGRMMRYDDAWVRDDRPFQYYHEPCTQEAR